MPVLPLPHAMSSTSDVVQRFAVPLRVVERKDTRFALYPLSKDEEATVDAIIRAEPFSDIVLGPNHHFDADGAFKGFRVSYPAHSLAAGLPINHSMFFGHTVAEVCSNQGAMNSEVIRLVGQAARNRELMRELLEEIDRDSTGHEPCLECMPQRFSEHTTAAAAAADRRVSASVAITRNSIDSRPWEPELPDFIGIYHTFTRGYNKDVREHKMYIVCSGGCPLAAETYYNVVMEINDKMDVNEVCESEETWWLRNASFRARCRLLHKLAEKFELKVTTIKDVHSYDEQTNMVRASTDTVYNDITALRSGHIAVFNHVVDTTTCKNGIVNPMHPKEGVWIFKGPQRSSAGVNSMGSSWGDQRSGGIFPSGAFCITQPKRDPQRPTARGLASITTETSELIVCHRCSDVETKQGAKQHTQKTSREFSWYDESCLNMLSTKLQWDRNAGVVELMPIIVGITKW